MTRPEISRNGRTIVLLLGAGVIAWASFTMGVQVSHTYYASQAPSVLGAWIGAMAVAVVVAMFLDFLVLPSRVKQEASA